MIAMEYMEDTSKQEILDAIGAFAEQVDVRFEKMDQKFDRMDQKLDRMEGRIGKVESQMVTKSYLDDKLAGLRGDLIALTRKANVKLSVLVETLVKDGTLKQKTADLILAMEPFAQG